MTREQIAPCPCGGKPFIRNETDEDGAYWSWVECGKCGLRTRGKWVSHRSNTCPMHYESVREQWNVIFSTATAILDAMPAPVWPGTPISTKDRLPEKPGKRSYEHVRCLIFIKSEWEIGMWNCEHLCWADEYGDDFRYNPTEPEAWMPLPAPPTPHPEQPEPIREAARVLLQNTPNPIFDRLKYPMSDEFSWSREVHDENGDEVTETLTVPWATIKEIVAAALRALEGGA